MRRKRSFEPDALMGDERPTVLVADGDPDGLAEALRERGYSVYTATTVAETRRLSLAASFDGAVVELIMADGTVYDLIPMLRREHPRMPIIVATSQGSVAAAVHSVRLGATDFLLKPARVDVVIGCLSGQPGDALGGLDGESLARIEWEHINRILAASRGNISDAARRLGIPRRSLQRKLRKFPPPR